MKPLQIVVLVAAGAIAGAIVLKVSHKAQPAPVTAQLQPPPATAPPIAEPVPAAPLPVPPVAEPVAEPIPATPRVIESVEVPVDPPKPSPLATRRVAHRDAPKPARPPAVAVNHPPATVPPIVQAEAPPPPPERAAPIEVPIPPARQEPEKVTPAPPPPAPPEPHRVTLNAGMLIPVRLIDGLTSERNLPGDSFTATLDKALVADGFVIAERGARVEGRVVSSDRGGRVKGVSTLQVELVRLRTSDGQNIAIKTDGFERRAEESRRQDVEKVGAGAALGAVIGAIAGGGKGAAIGAGVGSGAGAGAVLATRGTAATLPSETRVTFRLNTPVTITEKLRG